MRTGRDERLTAVAGMAETPRCSGPILISALPQERQEARLPACATTTNVQIEVSHGHRLPFPAVKAAMEQPYARFPLLAVPQRSSSLC